MLGARPLQARATRCVAGAARSAHLVMRRRFAGEGSARLLARSPASALPSGATQACLWERKAQASIEEDEPATLRILKTHADVRCESQPRWNRLAPTRTMRRRYVLGTVHAVVVTEHPSLQRVKSPHLAEGLI
jgi:hypothetical protein